ncbi:Ran-binding protein 9 [Smittium culicis]|uniref:Ran-binding protein 9 n=1 Tax=Smittium culicis TaxID=133412 RepID=A0A1R1YSI6_9FUNG|nr:Ran-binding protein 9 [Smittium culicis]
MEDQATSDSNGSNENLEINIYSLQGRPNPDSEGLSEQSLAELELGLQNPQQGGSSGFANFSSFSDITRWTELATEGGIDFLYQNRSGNRGRGTSRTARRGRPTGISYSRIFSQANRTPRNDHTPFLSQRSANFENDDPVTTIGNLVSDIIDLEYGNHPSNNQSSSNDGFDINISASDAKAKYLEMYREELGLFPDSDNSEYIDISEKLSLPSYLINTSFGKTRTRHFPAIKKFISNFATQIDDLSLDSTSPSPAHEILKKIDCYETMIAHKIFVSKNEYIKFMNEKFELRQSLSIPFVMSKSDSSKHVNIMDDRLQVRYSGPGNEDKDSGMVRANCFMPQTSGIFYFETKIVSKGKNGYIGIGFCTVKVILDRLPGWDSDSWGYHGDDGNSFQCSGSGKKYGPQFTTGDIIGCGVNFINREAFFVKNGVYLGVAFSNLDTSKSLYPSVGMRTLGEEVTLNFGKSPFVFDIDSYVHEHRLSMWRSVLSTDITSLSNSSALKCTGSNSKSDYAKVQGTGSKSNTSHKNFETSNDIDMIDNECKNDDINTKPQNESDFTTQLNANKNLPSSFNNPKEGLLFNLKSVINKKDPSKFSTSDAINELVLSYLIHNGYNNSAESFAKNSVGISNNHDFRISNNTIAENKVKSEKITNLIRNRSQQVARRKEICELIKNGNILESLQLIEQHYPSIMSKNIYFIFSLRCQHFIELARASSSSSTPSSKLLDPNFCMKVIDDINTEDVYVKEKPAKSADFENNPWSESSSVEKNNKSNTSHLRKSSFDMDIDEESFDISINNGFRNESSCSLDNESYNNEEYIDTFKSVYLSTISSSYRNSNPDKVFDESDLSYMNPSLLDPKQAAEQMMLFGQSLSEYYTNPALIKTYNELSLQSNSNEIEFESKLESVFSVLSYEDPTKSPETSYLFDVKRRIIEAEIANIQILQSEGKTIYSPLEMVYRQSDTCLLTLNDTFFEPKSSLILMDKKFS